MPILTYLQAIRQAIEEEMERDPTVFLLGEDIAQYGGAFKLTVGLLDQFGADRVIDTPIAENGIVGVAAGAAMMGFRPVVEMQFIDFISGAFNQLTNLVAKFRYRTGRSLPLVVRGPSGGGVGAGPFHSQSPEAYFLHTPGLKIVAPATPQDAKGLMKAAIRNNDPVIFLEYKSLYRQVKQDVLEIDLEIGKAEVVQSGTELTVITYGPMLHKSLNAAIKLQDDEGIHIEVIDLRTLMPLDMETILDSVKRTNKVLVVHEATRFGGLGAEIVAQIGDAAFEFLDGPLLRITGKDAPLPYNTKLEEAFLPQVEDIIRAARWLAKF